MGFAGCFQHYFKLNRILLTALGLWPYNDSVFRSIKRIFFTLLLSFSICIQWTKILTSVSDLESLLQILWFAVPCLVFSVKYATFCIKSKDIKILIEQMEYHWNEIKCKEELKILQQYASISKLIIILITILMYTAVFIFLTMQGLPKFLDIVAPLNESRPFQLVGIATLFFDQEKYFVPIFVHMVVALLMETTTILATETMLIIYMQHACGIFKIVSFRIEHAFDCELHISITEKNRMYYANIINAVVIHNKAIEFFEIGNSCFEISYFILFVLGVLSLSINMFRLFEAVLKNEMETAVASGMFVIAHFCYMFVNNFVAQMVTDHSADVYYKTCDLPWYSVPIRLQKLLQFIIQRSIKSNKFILVSIFDISVERFTSLVSVSLSYFTVFWSMRR